MEQQKYTLAQFRTLAINGLIKNYFHAKSCMLHVGFQKVRKLYKSLIVDHFYKKKKKVKHTKKLDTSISQPILMIFTVFESL